MLTISMNDLMRRLVKRARRGIVLFVAAALTSISATPKQFAYNNLEPLVQTTTTTIPMLPGTTQPINVTRGYQENGRVACNLVSYTNDDAEGTSLIRYFDFATNTDHVVPGNGLDRLATTDGRRIAFTQLEATGDHVVIYDIASQSSTEIPQQSTDPSIGGNLVALQVGAYNDPNSQIDVYDLNTGTITPLTNDSLRNRNPEVSPDGSIVVWEKCQGNGTGCDIYSSTQTGPGAFTTPRLLTGAGEDRYPHTNGQFVVYTSDKSGENDIYFQRVGGSTEMHISMSGIQYDPHISGNAIVFLSQIPDAPPNSGYDVFLYDLSTARLYRVTNAAGYIFGVADVVTGCNGVSRIVYMSAGGYGDSDLYQFTFQLNDSVPDQLDDLISLVRSFNLPAGTENSLVTKLQDALTAIAASDTATACTSLTAFINASQAQLGKKLTADQVKQLVDSATQVKTDLGCQ